ncbi:beta lactamase like protein [Venturia nashicola]|nr:beta lactamase like protein [Venturia nashicola]
MWIKNKSRASQERKLRDWKMLPPLAEFEQKLQRATSSDDDQSLPNVAVIAADSNGRILTSMSSGTYIPRATVEKPNDAGVIIEPATEKFTADTICWIASCTKLMTSVAALQLVELGLLNLDDDIAQTVLPELKGIQILIKMTDEGPVSRPAKNKITLRNLLTHSSGIAYEFTHPKLFAWRQWSNQQAKKNKAKTRSVDPAVAYLVPLLFEPDEGWTYGYSLDWVGVAVSRVSGLSLGEYMQKNIWTPLGMTSTAFHLEERPDLLSRLASMSTRNDEGKLEHGGIGGPFDPFRLVNVRESGGGGAFSTANDYIKFLIAVLQNNGKLFKSRDTIPNMMSPHLNDPAHLAAIHANPMSYGLAGNLPQDTKLDYALGGITNLTEVSTTGRAEGSIQWSGLPNLFWWINQKDGICGCYFGQILPPGDVPSFLMYEEFEKAVNASFVKDKVAKGKL